MNLTPFVVSWAVLATAVVALAIWRQVVARREDDCVHVSVDVTAQQKEVANKLDVIDRWGKRLTIIAAVYGLIVACLFLYKAWVEAGRPIS
jgi:hypothetical protein